MQQLTLENVENNVKKNQQISTKCEQLYEENKTLIKNQ